jgi:hypothetical protein
MEFTIVTTSEGASKIAAFLNRLIEAGVHDLDKDKVNNDGELVGAAVFLVDPERFGSEYPKWWPIDLRNHYEELDEESRLVVAGTYIARRIDQINYDNILSNGKSSELER